MRSRAWFAVALSAGLVSSPVLLAAQSRGNVDRARATGVAASQPVSLVLTDVSIQDALDTLSDIGDVRFTFSSSRIPLSRRVSIRADSVPFDDLVRSVLEDLGLTARSTRSGILVLTPAPQPESLPDPSNASEPQESIGSIAGRVTDASTGAGISGASVLVEGTDIGAVTGNTGRYRIADVPAGAHTVVVQQIGYAEARQSVAVSDGAESTADFALEVSALPLDAIVATGTAFETRLRTVPNPISVMNAEQIEQKGATNITDLLRGEFPGVMPLSPGQNDYVSYIYVRGNSSGSGQDQIKVYLDGVEVAHPRYLSTIDPRSIERIEVVRGPQSSTIYGSDAASGVLQVFTKKGTALARPRLDFQASTGFIQSAYSPSNAATPLTQDYSLSVSGGGESLSYRAGAAYATVGEWVKDYDSRSLSLSAGMRVVHGPITAELTALRSDRDANFGESPLWLRFPPSEACPTCGNPDWLSNSEFALSQNTVGLTLVYRATPSWQHTLTVGNDQNRFSVHQPEPSFNTPADTFVHLNNREFRRRSLRYSTAYDSDWGRSITARFTAGAEHWSYNEQGSSAFSLLNAFGIVRPSPSTSVSLSNDGWWNSGYFGMTELGFGNRLYLTLAARVESNPNLGEDYGSVFAPRVGASYVRGFGPAELKLRAQWGKGVRPPQPVARAGRVFSSTLVYLPNSEIAPEEKIGWDAGVELYWGNRFSISLSRFDEEARDLITVEPIDLTGTTRLYQYRNVGIVSIKGWELEGKVEAGPLSLTANYTYSDNLFEKVDAASEANPNAAVRVGDRVSGTPKHSGGGRITAQLGSRRVSLDASVMADWLQLDNIAYYGWQYAGEPYRGSTRAYYKEYPALWKWNLRAEQAVADRWAVFVRVDNLTNNQDAGFDNFNVAPGRMMVVGLRGSF